MKDAELDRQMQRFMADPKLVQLCERQRTGDEVLDVISLKENQHSDILAWMLDAREGHGQGDEILRDLLMQASLRAADESCPLDKRGATARFFRDWPPSRIRTTGFGAAFTARELGLAAKERVDLFVIDAQNRFVLVIENKAGAKLTRRQLDHYRDKFDALRAEHPHLDRYQRAYLALDRDFDADAEGERASEGSWLHLGYDWLQTSAQRARLHVERGNAAAQLVVSYCHRQTDGVGPEGEVATSLAVHLHQAYPEAVKHLIGFSGIRLEKAWLKEPVDDAHLLFLLQNKGVMSILKDTRGMYLVRTALLDRLPSFPLDNIEHSRARVMLCPRGWEAFMGDEQWPVFFDIRVKDAGESTFTAYLCWHAASAANADAAAQLRHWLEQVDPRFRRFPQSVWRRTVVKQGAKLDELVQAIVDMEQRLVQVLPAAG